MKRYMVDITFHEVHRVVVDADNPDDVRKMIDEWSGPFANWTDAPVVRQWTENGPVLVYKHEPPEKTTYIPLSEL